MRHLASGNSDQPCLSVRRLLHLDTRRRLGKEIQFDRDTQITVCPSASAVSSIILKDVWSGSIQQPGQNDKVFSKRQGLFESKWKVKNSILHIVKGEEKRI